MSEFLKRLPLYFFIWLAAFSLFVFLRSFGLSLTEEAFLIEFSWATFFPLIVPISLLAAVGFNIADTVIVSRKMQYRPFGYVVLIRIVSDVIVYFMGAITFYLLLHRMKFMFLGPV
ncbi:MAG: hypothetical protein HRT74_11920, partial [Flavobacteriales bacterium]|nr:hypothetical protein [Flavobacteriales bacterium]